MEFYRPVFTCSYVHVEESVNGILPTSIYLFICSRRGVGKWNFTDQYLPVHMFT